MIITKTSTHNAQSTLTHSSNRFNFLRRALLEVRVREGRAHCADVQPAPGPQRQRRRCLRSQRLAPHPPCFHGAGICVEKTPQLRRSYNMYMELVKENVLWLLYAHQNAKRC